MNSYFCVYINLDIVGVEFGGVLKNIIVLVVGIIDGFGLGDNVKVVLMICGLIEIVCLGRKMGGNLLMFVGLIGMGDLIVICISVYSWNWCVGNMFGKGYFLEEVLESMGMVVEGVRIMKVVYELVEKMEVEMLIIVVLYDVLFNGNNVKDVVGLLMGCVWKYEVEVIFDLL